MNREFSPFARLLLWDYPRGSAAYGILCVILLVLLAVVPAAWWGDPMLRP